MLDAKGRESRTEHLSLRAANRAFSLGDANGEARPPVVIVLHQPQSSPGHVGQWLVRNGYRLDIRRPRFGDALPETLENHAGAVIFGGPMSANDSDDYIKVETDWIGVALKENQPFLGICLGAQMLARHLGASVDLHPKDHVEIGYRPIEATSAARRICEWPETVYQWHKEGFEVPHGGCLLARAEGPFENQAFAFGEAACGVQFHPEITLAQVHRWTGYNPDRLELPGARPREEQIAAHYRHAPRVHRWLDVFMTTWLARGLAHPAAAANKAAE